MIAFITARRTRTAWIPPIPQKAACRARIEQRGFGRLAFSTQIPPPLALVDEARQGVFESGNGKGISEEELAWFF
jgi:hypothetical protein